MRNKPLVAVLFKSDEEGARIYKNPPHLDQIKKHGEVLLNPDTSRVNGLAPDQWRLKRGKIVPHKRLRTPKRETVNTWLNVLQLAGILTLIYLQIKDLI